MPSLKTVWAYGLKGARKPSHRRPVRFGDSVLVTINHGLGSNFQGCLASVELETGTEKWRFEHDHIFGRPAVSDSGFVYITAFSGHVFKLDRVGKLCWQSQPSARNLGHGVLRGEHIIYAEIAGQAKFTRALNCDDGSVAWEYENGGHSYALATDNAGHVVHSSVTGRFESTQVKLHCIDTSTGQAIWTTNNPDYLFQPCIDEDYIYVGSRGYLAIFDRHSGALLHTHKTEHGKAILQTPVRTAAGVLCAGEGGQIVSLDVSLGKKGLFRKPALQVREVWSQSLGSAIKTGVVCADDTAYVMTEDGQFLALDVATGARTRQAPIPQFTEAFGMCKVEDDWLIAASRNCARLRWVS